MARHFTAFLRVSRSNESTRSGGLTIVVAMTDATVRSEPEVDAATVRRLARLAGLELTAARAERLVPDLATLIEADRRLAALDLGEHAATGDPWGRAPADG
jgi:hypothetical protein